MTTKAKRTLKPGDQVEEGVVCAVGTDGVLVGRLADEGETCPPGHTEHRFGAARAFLSAQQGPIPAEALHAGKAQTDAMQAATAAKADA